MMDPLASQILIDTLNDEDYRVRHNAIHSLGQNGDIEGLIIALGHKTEFEVRARAAEELGRMLDARAVDPLIAALKDEIFWVPINAAEALGKIGDVRAIDPLIAVLKRRGYLECNEHILCSTAVKALDKLGWKPGLNEDGAWYWIGKRDLERCVAIGSPAVKPLVVALSDTHGDRRGAAITLGKIGDSHAVGPLISALKDENEDVRRGAADALDALGWSTEVYWAWYWIAKGNWEKCIAIGAPAVDSLIYTLNISWDNQDIRKALIRSLGEIGDSRAVGPLILTLKNSREDVSKAAADALETLGWIPDLIEDEVWYWLVKRDFEKCVAIGSPAVQPLIEILKDRGWDIRKAIIRSLGEIGDARAVGPLILTLKNSEEDIRRASADALEKLGWIPDLIEDEVWYWLVKGDFEKCVAIGSPAVQPLIEILKDRGWDIRKAVIRSLGEIGDARAVCPLILTLKNSEQDVRRAAADALEKLGWIPDLIEDEVWYWLVKGDFEKCVAIGSPAIQPLIEILKDWEWEIRKGAAEALNTLGWKPGLDENGAWFWIARGEFEKCIDIGMTSVEPLIELLDDEDEGVINAAIEALGKIGDSRAVEPLIELLDDEDWGVINAAIEALGEIGDSRAVEPLIELLDDEGEETYIIVFEALVKIGIPSIVPIIEILKYREWEIRKGAAEALNTLGWKPCLDENSAWFWIARRNFEKCINICTVAVEPLITTLDWGLSDMEIYIRTATIVEEMVAVISVLGTIGDTRAINPLIAALKNSELDIRNTAAEGLEILGWKPDFSENGANYWSIKGDFEKCADIGAPAVVPLIYTILDKNPNTYLQAVVALGRIGNERAIDGLIYALRNCNEEMQIALIEALSKRGTPAVEPLISNLLYVNEDVRKRIILVLEKIGTPAIDTLIESLVNENKDIRTAVIEALGNIGNSIAVGPLFISLKDKEEEVRRAAAVALEKLGWKPGDAVTSHICPSCQSILVIPIVYGYPTAEAGRLVEAGIICLGGCKEGEEKWHCKNCHREW